jgi:hypothetical protein
MSQAFGLIVKSLNLGSGVSNNSLLLDKNILCETKVWKALIYWVQLLEYLLEKSNPLDIKLLCTGS